MSEQAQEQLQPIQESRRYELPTQKELEARYKEVRDRNVATMRKSSFGFWSKLDAGDKAGAVAALQAENSALLKRLETLEQLVLERETSPEPAPKKAGK